MHHALKCRAQRVVVGGEQVFAIEWLIPALAVGLEVGPHQHLPFAIYQKGIARRAHIELQQVLLNRVEQQVEANHAHEVIALIVEGRGAGGGELAGIRVDVGIDPDGVAGDARAGVPGAGACIEGAMRHQVIDNIVVEGNHAAIVQRDIAQAQQLVALHDRRENGDELARARNRLAVLGQRFGPGTVGRNPDAPTGVAGCLASRQKRGNIGGHAFDLALNVFQRSIVELGLVGGTLGKVLFGLLAQRGNAGVGSGVAGGAQRGEPQRADAQKRNQRQAQR